MTGDPPFMPGQAVLWLDPGKTTGWAKLVRGKDFYSGQEDFMGIGNILLGHCTGYYTTWQRDKIPGYKDQDNVWTDIVIGWEQFNITSHTWRLGDNNWALEVIGVARWHCMSYGKKMLQPATRESRNIVSFQLLKAAGWHKPGMDHANDAARHLLAWVIRDGSATPEMKELIRKYVKE